MKSKKTLEIWKEFFKFSRNLKLTIIIVGLLAILLWIYPKFINIVELRKGFSYQDPILILFCPIDLTALIFVTLYLSVMITVFYLRNKPILLLTGITGYSVLIIFRILAMYLLPLEPPKTMLKLNDPFVQFFGTGQMLTKDLFFSGHTSMMFLLVLLVPQKHIRAGLIIGTVIIAVSVILQHVHYCIDVFSAPFFAFTSFSLAKKLMKVRMIDVSMCSQKHVTTKFEPLP